MITPSNNRNWIKWAYGTEITGSLGLTPAEFATALLTAQGLPNKGIAEELSISIKTVEKYRTAVYDKWGVHDTISMIAKLFNLGLVTPEWWMRCIVRRNPGVLTKLS